MSIYMNNVAAGGGGSWDYSTTEQNTGQKWFDGKDIYVKVITEVTPLSTTQINFTGSGVFPYGYVDTVIDSLVLGQGANTHVIQVFPSYAASYVEYAPFITAISNVTFNTSRTYTVVLWYTKQ